VRHRLHVLSCSFPSEDRSKRGERRKPESLKEKLASPLPPGVVKRCRGRGLKEHRKGGGEDKEVDYT